MLEHKVINARSLPQVDFVGKCVEIDSESNGIHVVGVVTDVQFYDASVEFYFSRSYQKGQEQGPVMFHVDVGGFQDNDRRGTQGVRILKGYDTVLNIWEPGKGTVWSILDS